MRYDNLIWDFDGTLFDTYPPMCRDLRRPWRPGSLVSNGGAAGQIHQLQRRGAGLLRRGGPA